ncbi:MAG: GNAT family N-acetyltransferase [Oscillospiraceae bacterium]
MEELELHYRTVRPEDYRALEEIICKTWNYERFCAPKTAARLAKLFLASCLANQTYTCVAVKGEEPVGVIMGKNEKTHRKSPAKILRQLGALLGMAIRKEGRKVLRQFGGYSEINRSLAAENTHVFGGEVAFFAVRGDQRGNGVGKELFARLRGYMQSQNIADFYLYTDSSCNYGFYNHQGMVPVCEKKCRMEAFGGREMSFFLYGYCPV